jgi:hypothetical protein
VNGREKMHINDLKNITALLLGGVRGGKTLFKNSLYGH